LGGGFHARRGVGLRAASRGRLEAARETRPGREASRVHLHAMAAAGADGEGLRRGLNRALLCYLLIHRPLLFVGCAMYWTRCRAAGPLAPLFGLHSRRKMTSSIGLRRVRRTRQMREVRSFTLRCVALQICEGCV